MKKKLFTFLFLLALPVLILTGCANVENYLITDGEYKLWGMEVKYDITNGEGGMYSNAEQGFYTRMAGFNLTECRIDVTKQKLIFKHYSDYNNPQNDLMIELIFNREDNDDFYPYFSYSSYSVQLNGEDVKTSTDFEHEIQNLIEGANQLNTVLSAGISTMQIISNQRNFACYLTITDTNGNLIFLTEIFGTKI